MRLRKRDSVEKPAPNSIILFTGSSSFTKWTDVKDYYPGYPIINRAFGGSTLVDMIRYVDEADHPYYRPKQIVIYCGENDVAASDTVTAQMVLQRFQTLFSLIRNKLPKVQIAFVSLKPSPSRWKLEPIYVEANKLIKDFISKQSNTTFINIHNAMLKPDGSVMTDIFLSDNLHMNAEGV
jgi:lysophospholipase L1-like esterase